MWSAKDAVRSVLRYGMCAGLLSLMMLRPDPAQAQATDEFAPFVYDQTRPNVLKLEGEIDLRTPVRLGNALNRHAQIDTLELASPGGSAYGALLMVDRIHEAGLTTVIPAGQACNSACAFLFLAGVERAAAGNLGVHQLSGTNLATGLVTLNDVLDMFDRFGVPAEVRRRMLDTPPEEMHVFSHGDLERLKLVGLAREAATGPGQTRSQTAAETGASPSPQVGLPPVLTVKADGSGDHSAIVDALSAAPEGARIEIHPGIYTGGFMVSKSVDIVGVGSRDSVILAGLKSSFGGSVVTWAADGGSMSGLTIRHEGGRKLMEQSLVRNGVGAISIQRGAPTIRDCGLSVSSIAGNWAIKVQGSTSAPRILDNVITGGATGILVLRNGRSTIAGNDISGCEVGIEAEKGAQADIGENRIHGCQIPIRR